MPGGKGRLTKKHGAIVRGILLGKPRARIACEQKIHRTTVADRLNLILPFLHEKTKNRLIIKGSKFGQKTTRVQVVTGFLDVA